MTNAPNVGNGDNRRRAKLPPRPSADAILANIEAHQSPPPLPKPYYEVLTLPAATTRSLVAVSRMVVVGVHYVFGRTWPHLKQSCVCEGQKLHTRTQGYVAVYDLADGFYKVLTLPERAIRGNATLNSGKDLTRHKLIVKRIGNKPNGRVSVHVGEIEACWKTCRLPTINPLEVMAEHWARGDKQEAKEAAG